MGKQPTSTTQNTFPPWLSSALKPLIGGATENMGTFMNQGFNVLQGRPPGGGASAGGPAQRGPAGGPGGRNPKLEDLRELAKGLG